MAEITDEYMKGQLAQAKQYTTVILKKGPNFNRSDVMNIIWEHARYNFKLKAEGALPIVCPINDGSDVVGIGVFATDIERTKQILEEDPGVKDGVFVFELHEARSFPGSVLP